MSEIVNEKFKGLAELTYDSVTKRYDLPRKQALERLSEIKKLSEGTSRLYFKFTCQKCKARCMFRDPDILYEIGICPECDTENNIKEAGFMVVTEFKKRKKRHVVEPPKSSESTEDGE